MTIEVLIHTRIVSGPCFEGIDACMTPSGVRALLWLSLTEYLLNVQYRRARIRLQRCNNLQQHGRALREKW